MVEASREEGSSLVEALITFGLLASILLSSLGLFTLGARGLRSARSASQAFAAARSILEEIGGWSYADLYRKWGVDGASTTYAIDTGTNAYAARWQPLLADLPGASAVIHVESLPFDGGAEPLASAKGVRIVVAVSWDEAGRAREARVGTVRF